MNQTKKIKIKCKFGKIKGICWGSGQKNKILALHGWLDNAASFNQLAPKLAEIGYEVVAIDFAGHGDVRDSTPITFASLV